MDEITLLMRRKRSNERALESQLVVAEGVRRRSFNRPSMPAKRGSLSAHRPVSPEIHTLE